MTKPKEVVRRDLLRTLGLGAGVAVTATGSRVEQAAADGETNDNNRRERYQADSPDVQAYYHTNRYPAK